MKKLLLTIGTIIGIIALYLVYDHFTWEHYSKKELPDSATEVQEFRTDVFPSDFWDCMIATITREDYDLYIKDIDPYWEIPLEANPDVGFGGYSEAPEWWNPPTTNDTTHSRRKGTTVEVITYHDGKLYYMTYET